MGLHAGRDGYQTACQELVLDLQLQMLTAISQQVLNNLEAE
ncbi:MAG TPA: hypothetical protein VGP03_03095 [Pseudonocardiaceae bacterium]|nr:hypothetical protein [Pseudonocardiaceae bacterium]